MSWRLKAIGLYRRDEDGFREVPFHQNGLNVISGDSQTGKSAVIDIVNYCLMSRACSIPKGPIREAVGAVGIHLTSAVDELVVIRKVPSKHQKTSDRTWIETGHGLSFPAVEPEPNSNKDRSKAVISGFTQIIGAEVLTDQADPSSPLHQSATIRHVVPLIFQPQDVIANRHVTFPELTDQRKRQHMLDALPFLLGIDTSEILAKRKEIRRVKSDLRILELRGAERRKLRAHAYERGNDLWMQCHAAGLIQGKPPADVYGLLTGLEAVKNVSFDRVVEIQTTVPNLDAAQDAEAEARKGLLEKRRRL